MACLVFARIPGVALWSWLLAAAGLYVYGRATPFTSLLGLATTFGLPAIVTMTRNKNQGESSSLIVFMAGWTPAMPILLRGLYVYFHYAPGPRSLRELCLAIFPAMVAGFLGSVIAGLLIARENESPTTVVKTP
jgi:hypothetical protein